MKPTIELIPLKPAVRSDAATTLDVLIRIVPPVPERQTTRPALNLGIVLDRSGSMAAARKLDYAREAASFAVQQLLPSDRVSITVFDDHVQTLIPNTAAENKAAIIKAIGGVVPGNSTDLHAGWKEGAEQVRKNLVPGGLNRVLLLSDGIANVGETNADVIATEVHRLAGDRVSTTTLGLGDEYNEDLLEAMAKSGDGNYFYIEDSRQLPDVFQTELRGLMATVGNSVQLKVEPSAGVPALDVLNDFDTTPEGACKLPNLVAGMPLLAVVRLTVVPLSGTNPLARIRLTWTAPDRSIQDMNSELSLPAVKSEQWESLAAHVEVEERAALLLIARFKKKATICIDQGNAAEAAGWLAKAKQILDAGPSTPEMQVEAEALRQIQEMLEMGETRRFQKHAKYQAHMRRSSR